jgi:glycosyltransferase involved in cell wall biosynthesis
MVQTPSPLDSTDPLVPSPRERGRREAESTAGFLVSPLVAGGVRVAFVTMTTAHHEQRWYPRRTQAVAEHLAARGHDVTVVCTQWWGGDHATFEFEGVTYRRVTTERSPRAFVSKLPFVLNSVRPDVVHVATRPLLAVPAAKVAGRLGRIPVVAEWWACPDGASAHTWRSTWAARAPATVLVPSETVATRARERGVPPDAIETVPDSVDMAGIRAAPVDARADLVYARPLDEHANVEEFLLALAELRQREWRAAIVGDGPARPDAERMARDLRIDDRVEFLGSLSPAEQVPILKGAHVFAQTATWEPFATGLLRALACGCVGVVEYQKDSAAHELVEADPRGSLVTSPRELADEIVAATDLERWTVNEDYAPYDHDAVRARYVDCYERLVADYGLF